MLVSFQQFWGQVLLVDVFELTYQPRFYYVDFLDGVVFVIYYAVGLHLREIYLIRHRRNLVRAEILETLDGFDKIGDFGVIFGLKSLIKSPGRPI